MAGSGKVPKGVLDEIRARIDVVAVVGEHVQLRKAGKDYKGLCPFHEEKSPSFHVSPQKRIYHCFGCGEGGDVFSFLMKRTGQGFREVLDELASMAGVDLTPYRSQREGPNLDRGDFFTANKAACEFYRRQLEQSGRARGYLDARGLDPATREAFAIGFAPEGWSHLLDHMVGRGFSADLLAEIGLVKRRKESSGHYDAFRERVTFPIRDEHGRIVAFGARRIGDGDSPKYVNSPESPFYTKGQHLYNLDRALRALQADSSVLPILCEGYMDVIAFHRAGIESSVANLGTALTQSQAGRMSRLRNRWILAYDSDQAGMRAAVRAVQLLDPLGVECRVLSLGGKDPDEVLEKEGPEALQRALERARPVDEFLFEAIAKAHDLASTQGRSEAFRELRGIFQGLANPVLKQALIRQIADGLSLSEELVQQAFRSSPEGRSAARALANRARDEQLPVVQQAERTILREILQDATLYHEGPAGVLSAGTARDPYVKNALLAIEDLPDSSGPILQELLDSVEDENLARFLRGLEFDEAPAGDDAAEQRILECLECIEAESTRLRRDEVKRAMLACREPEQRRRLTAEFQELSQRIAQFKSRESTPTHGSI